MENLEWFVIPKYPTYEINLKFEVRHRVLKKIKRYYTDENGYFRTNIQVNGKKVKPGQHQLVAMTFIPNPEKKPEVNHKDGDKKNNRISNLEWATQAENKRHALENDLISHKVNNEGVLFIRENYMKMGVTALSKKFKIKRSTVIAIATGRSRKHIGGTITVIPNYKRVVDISTGDIFESVEKLSEITGIKIRSLRRMVSGERYNHTNYRYLGEESRAKLPPPPKPKKEKPPKAIRIPRPPYVPHPLPTKNVVMLDLSGVELRVFASSRDAAEHIKTSLATFRKWIRTTTTGFHKGYIFRYAS